MESKMTTYIDVALPLRVDRVFQYSLPEGFAEPPPLGSLVRIPFGTRTTEGFCVGHGTVPAVRKVRDIIEVVSDVPPLPAKILKLGRWMSRYYATPLGSILSAIVPQDARSGRGRTRKRVRLAVPRDQAEEARAAFGKGALARARILEILLSQESGAYPMAALLALAETSASPVRTLQKAGLVAVEVEDAAVAFPPLPPPTPPGLPFTLTPAQDQALEELTQVLNKDESGTFLLHGVTGSGKTEVYLRAIRTALDLGRQTITLVPEIALTPQMVGRYMERFDRVAVWHSGLTAPQRRESWRAIHEGRIDMVVGARSAIFAPFARLGLIVVDEEHEPSFKQMNEPRYNARDVAVLRGQIEGVPVILGSATPSLESHQNALSGKYRLHSLPARVDDLALPPVEIVNLATEKRRGTGGIISERLRLLTDKTLRREEQAIFFLNRRGFSTLVQCPACGFSYTCPHCGISLTYHRAVGRVVCHYCSYGAVPEATCPECLKAKPKKIGVGTEQVEKALHDLFPQAGIVRMDSDSVSRPQDYQDIFTSFREGRKDILIGTQMVAKGFDFPNVTLVGVILADLSLNVPDFRSAERTFQLITQVAGRAGRSRKGGHVVVQTFKPDHYSIGFAREHDFAGFAQKEMAFRRSLGYPPFGHIARILLTGRDRPSVHQRAAAMAVALRSAASPVVRLLGPAPAPIEVIRETFRMHILLLSPRIRDLHAALSAVRSLIYGRGKVRASLDVDPIDMM
jgi:primosomal protein N' (replication factor Y)